MAKIIQFPLSETMEMKQQTLESSLAQFVKAFKNIESDAQYLMNRAASGEFKDEVVNKYCFAIGSTISSMREYTELVLKEYFGIEIDNTKPW